MVVPEAPNPPMSFLNMSVLSLRRPRMWHGNRKVKVKTCLEDVIEPKLRKLTVKPDGRCMFRSIAKSLAYSKKLEMNDDAEKVSADMLREEAFKIICVQKREWFTKMGFVEGDIDTYCNRMKFADFFGGEPELYVISEEVLKRPIAVYMEKKAGEYTKLLEYGSSLQNKKKKDYTIRLLYNGVNHYDALVVVPPQKV